MGLLPSLLGIGPGDVVVIPASAYPTYEVGARAPAPTPQPTDDPTPGRTTRGSGSCGSTRPATPPARCSASSELRAAVDAPAPIGAVVAGDECYAELGWEQPWASDGVPCLLDPRVTGVAYGAARRVLALEAVEPRRLPGGLLAGDTALVSRIVLSAPAPRNDRARPGAGGHDRRAVRRRARRRAARDLPSAPCAVLPALLAAGYAVDHSHAGLYLWVRSWTAPTAG